MILQVLGAMIFLFAIGVLFYYSRIYGVDRLILSIGFILFISFVLVSFPYLFREKLNLGFMRPLDAFLTLTSVSSLLLCLAVYFRLRKTERDLTKIVQEIALDGVSGDTSSMLRNQEQV